MNNSIANVSLAPKTMAVEVLQYILVSKDYSYELDQNQRIPGSNSTQKTPFNDQTRKRAINFT